MRSSTEPGGSSSTGLAGGARGFVHWNRRIHYWLGLYLLFFTWLFAFTGLLLNHSQWKFAEFWENRTQSTREREVVSPAAGNDLAQARELMSQLGIRGEIEWTIARNDPERLDFRVSRPGHIVEIKTDLARKRASVQRIDLNGWGIVRILHTFTGVRMEDTRNQRDWLLTSVWAFAMDAVALGLVLLVLTSLVLWFNLGRKRTLAGIVLLAGFATCALFCVGLRWLY